MVFRSSCRASHGCLQLRAQFRMFAPPNSERFRVLVKRLLALGQIRLSGYRLAQCRAPRTRRTIPTATNPQPVEKKPVIISLEMCWLYAGLRT